MKCDDCGFKLERSWRFCPSCGAELEKDVFGRLFDFENIFRRMDKESEEVGRIQKTMRKEMEVLDLSPWLKPTPAKFKFGGFGINIIQRGSGQPRISIRTFGDVKKEDVEKSLKSAPTRPGARKIWKMPAATEEPKAEIKRIGDRLVVKIDLPGTEEKNIEIRKLTESVEVKALSRDKAFFKILTLPQGFKLAKREFQNGKLTLELSV